MQQNNQILLNEKENTVVSKLKSRILALESTIIQNERTCLELEQAQEVKDKMLQAIPCGLVRVNMEGSIIYANPFAIKFLKLSFDKKNEIFITDFTYKTILEDHSPCKLTDYPVTKTLKTGSKFGPTTIGSKEEDGKVFWASYSSVPYFDPITSKLSGAIVTFVDISKDKQTIDKLNSQKQDTEELIQHFPHYLFRFKVDGTFTYANKLNTKKGKHTFQNLKYYDLFPPDKKKEAKQRIQDLIQSNKLVEYESQDIINNIQKSFHNICWTSKDSSGETIINQVSTEITERKNLLKELEIRSKTDFLTKLSNRYKFEKDLQERLENNDVAIGNYYLSYFDLDQFKIVNDTCGHFVGDKLLVNLCNTLNKFLSDSTIFARIGGDEFALIFPARDIGHARFYLESIRKKIDNFRFLWDHQSFQITASFGLMELPLKTCDHMTIMQDVDMATHLAKSKGGNQIHVFQQNDNFLHERKLELKKVQDIREAIERNLIKPFAQKILSANSHDDTFSIEILARIVKRNKILQAESFIQIAEKYNLIQKVDETIINQTINFFEENLKHLKKLKYITINLSGGSISNKDFLNFVLKKVTQSLIPKNKILFEITETVAISNLHDVKIFMERLNNMGCHFALDDFGSGFSSFGYLRDLPIEVLKIDGSFVRKVDSSFQDAVLIDGMTQLGKRLGKKVIAESVESKNILRKLRELQVDYIQGYYLHQPEPLNKLFK